MKQTVNSLDEFLNLDYEMKITPFKESDESGYVIMCPDLPGLEVYGDTISEALEEVDEAKIALFNMYEQLQQPVPLPKHTQHNAPSGRLTARLPKVLHQKLKMYAEQNDISLNTALIQILNDGFRIMELDTLTKEMENMKKMIERDIDLNVTYQKHDRDIDIPYVMEKQLKDEYAAKGYQTNYSYESSVRKNNTGQSGDPCE